MEKKGGGRDLRWLCIEPVTSWCETVAKAFDSYTNENKKKYDSVYVALVMPQPALTMHY